MLRWFKRGTVSLVSLPASCKSLYSGARLTKYQPPFMVPSNVAFEPFLFPLCYLEIIHSMHSGSSLPFPWNRAPIYGGMPKHRITPRILFTTTGSLNSVMDSIMSSDNILYSNPAFIKGQFSPRWMRVTILFLFSHETNKRPGRMFASAWMIEVFSFTPFI